MHQNFTDFKLIVDSLYYKYSDFINKYDVQDYFEEDEFYFILKEGHKNIHIIHAKDFVDSRQLFSNILYKLYNLSYNKFIIYKEYNKQIQLKKQTNGLD